MPVKVVGRFAAVVLLTTATAVAILLELRAGHLVDLLTVSAAMAFLAGSAVVLVSIARRDTARLLALSRRRTAIVLDLEAHAIPAAAPSLLSFLTVGVMAHNEALTVRPCLEALLAEHDRDERVARVVAVVSGSCDGTADVVRELAKHNDRVHLIVEPGRTGKANAINQFLAECSTPLAAIVSADVLLSPGSLTALADALRDETVGMAGGRIQPQNARRGLCNALVHLEWELHDAVARRRPKLGEVVVFRRTFSRVDAESLTDEVSIEAVLVSTGYRLVYVPEATVLNHGPTKLSDYVRHRSRIRAGHVLVQRRDGYTPATMRNSVVLLAVWDVLRRRPSAALLLATAIAAELWIRLRTALELHRHGRTEGRGTWAPITSAKRALPVPGAATAPLSALQAEESARVPVA